MAKDEYVEMAEAELEQAVTEWNQTGEVLEPHGRVRLAEVYALTSIARALHEIVEQNSAGKRR